MSRLMIVSDTHLGHKRIHKFRDQFSTAEEHDEIVYENLCQGINKRDTLYLLGDIAFTREWLVRVGQIKCRYKLLICGNHDTERGVAMKDLVNTYNDVKSLMTHRNYWFSHAPIHPQEIRGRLGNIHGHNHNKDIMYQESVTRNMVRDRRFINACLEKTDYKPIQFEELILRGVEGYD